MPLPFLAPIIGGLIGTAAAPALGMSAAVAAGLGSGIASLAAGADPKQALLSGLTGGIASGIMPGVFGAAGKGAEAAVARGAGAGGGAGAGVGASGANMAANTIAQETARTATGVGAGKLTQGAIRGAGAGGFDPMKALKLTQSMFPNQGQQAAPAPGNLLMNSGGGGGVSSAEAIQRFSRMQPGDFRFSTPPQQVQPIGDPSMQSNFQRIPLQPLRFREGGLASIAAQEMQQRGLSRLPNLGNREEAYRMAQQEFARGGYIEGPGTVTSDEIPGTIYQDGQPVGEIMVSNGEVVLSGKDLAQLDPDGNIKRAGEELGNAGTGNRGRKAADMFRKAEQIRKERGVS